MKVELSKEELDLLHDCLAFCSFPGKIPKETRTELERIRMRLLRYHYMGEKIED